MHNNLTPKKISYHTFDFGPGFYLTKSKNQAEYWAKKKSKTDLTKPILIRFDLSKLLNHENILSFTHANQHFLRYVRYCRISGKIPSNIKKRYSAIYGPMIDGKILLFVLKERSKCVFGNKTMHSVIRSIKINKFKKKARIYPFPTYNQLCIINNTSIKYLRNIKYFSIS